MNDGSVYLDWNATAPVLLQAAAAVMHTLQHAWANPSSTHAPGQAARRVLADARARVAAFLGARPPEVVFTSGATEANHAAVLGALAAARGGPRRRLVLSAVEHPGLLALAARLRGEGTPVDLIPVDGEGRLDLAAAERLIGDDVALVSVMGANNETGVSMPVAELAQVARTRGALLHVDATQVAGKAALSFAGSGADLMSVSAHKIGGPKGVGALLVRSAAAWQPWIAGRQERQRRGGTENLPGIAGFAAACEHHATAGRENQARMSALRDRLEGGLVRALPGVRVFGAGAERIANTSCLGFGGLDAEVVLAPLERASIVASSGAACSAGGTQPSHVLRAMGLDVQAARSGVRFSLGPATTEADIDRAIAATVAAVTAATASTASTALAFAPADASAEPA